MAVYRLETPISEGEARRLRAGDIVYLTGIVVTARDKAHRRILEYVESGRRLPVDLRGGVIYHCGPHAVKTPGGWVVLAAGPTTSMRMESVMAEVLQATGARLVIGKGGMGSRTLKALMKVGAAYAVFTGGAGSLAALSIKRVVDVHWLDLGVPEALWVLEVEDFGPLIVTMDSRGSSLHKGTGTY
ncbi:MAG: FumA C-terminus/TtdB family hydratase beta subunit [Desulfurococcales archaeon]|nr:FumA C-terminus/TtdB family hydratase beta subunit [Desulfurococcales archaeon]